MFVRRQGSTADQDLHRSINHLRLRGVSLIFCNFVVGWRWSRRSCGDVEKISANPRVKFTHSPILHHACSSWIEKTMTKQYFAFGKTDLFYNSMGLCGNYTNPRSCTPTGKEKWRTPSSLDHFWINMLIRVKKIVSFELGKEIEKDVFVSLWSWNKD